MERNELENRKKNRENQWNQKLVFRKINKIDTPPARFSIKIERRHKLPLQRLREVTPLWIVHILRKCYLQPHANKFDSLK